MKNDLFRRVARFAGVFLHAEGHIAESMQQNEAKEREKGTKKRGENVDFQSFRTLLFLTALASSPVLWIPSSASFICKDPKLSV